MRKYWEICKSAIKTSLQYSAWFWAGTAATIMKLLIIYYFWQAVYANKTEIGAMTLEMMITYIVLATLLGNYHTTGAFNEMARMIKDGNVAIELMRPYHLIGKVLAIETGDRLTTLVQSTIPMLLIGFLFMGVTTPVSGEAGALFLLSAVLGVVIGLLLDLIIGVLSFWTVNVFGLGMLKNAIFLFFTGALVPITLFPEWLQTVSAYLPFQSMVYVPVSIYTGAMAGAEAWLQIGLQLVWIGAVYVGLRGLWAFALRRVVIFGG